MIFNIATAPSGVSFNTPIFTYTGTAPQLFTDGDDWELVFTGDCVITFQRVSPAVEVFLCGGGNPGGAASGNIWGDGYYAQGGVGGKGGECKTVSTTISTGTPYTVKVGGSGQSSSGFGASASNGGGSNGGSGAFERKTPSARQAANAGVDGSYAFGDSATLYAPGRKYGPGGGGGGAANINQGGSAAASGGTTGGGDGGTSGHGTGYNGTDNTGGGGGGGYAKFDNTGDYWSGSGGSGGSGIVTMRNARAA